jgi:RsiW-degrading membrane proteinase PrsW (M82 family)
MSLFYLLLSAIAPAMLIIWLVYRSDKYDREPIPLLIKAFFGGLVSVAITMGLGSLYQLFMPTRGNDTVIFLHALIGVGLVEEFSKFLVLRYYFFRHRAFNEPFDGIIYAVMISMGFATLENIMYVFEGGLQVALARALTAVPAHAAFAVIMGYYVGAARFSFRKRRKYFLRMGVLFAALSHGLYDFFLMQESFPGLALLSFIVLLISVILSIRAIRIRQRLSPFRIRMRERVSEGGRSFRVKSGPGT